MSQEMINLIIGLVLGFLLSLITQIVNRKWKHHDEDDERKRRIITQRIEQLELFTREIAVTLSRFKLEGKTYLHITDKKERLQYLTNSHKEIVSLVAQVEYYCSIARYLGSNILGKLNELVSKLISADNLINNLLDQEMYGESLTLETEKIGKIAELFPVYSELLKLLDELKVRSSNSILKST